MVGFTGANRHGFVGDDGGGDENDVARAHLDDELKLMKYDVPAQLRVKVAEDDNGTATICKVFEVPTSETDCLGPEVDCHGGEGVVATNGIRLQAILLGDLGVCGGIELMKFWCPCSK